LPRESRADPRRAPQLVDRNGTRRRISPPRSETLHVEAQAKWRQCDAEEEAFELIV
jgi:hypothetical protein